jgi:hypothetical protein
MEMSKKQAEFWVALLVLCLIFAVAITLVDYGIKASILEQSNRIRLLIEEWEINHGRNATGANEVRTNDDPDNNTPIPSDVLVVNPPGMETGNDATGHTATTSNSRAQRPKPGRPASS